MPSSRSATKRDRQSLRRRARNRARIHEAKTREKKLGALIASGDGEGAAAALRKFESVADRAARSGSVHRRWAARKKSRLAKRLAAGRKAAG